MNTNIIWRVSADNDDYPAFFGASDLGTDKETMDEYVELWRKRGRQMTIETFVLSKKEVLESTKKLGREKV